MSECEIIVKMDKHIKIKGGSYVRDLIRCKDCKYWNNETDLTYCEKKLWLGTDATDYCSFGERADK